MPSLSLGVVATYRKADEKRLALHPAHLERLAPELRSHLLVERGYGERFDVSDDELNALVRLGSREEVFAQDVVLLPKPLPEDLETMRAGQVLWGWPHCVQDPRMTQNAIDRGLTLIAWEVMNHWTSDGQYDVHVFHRNNELAGYCSVLQAFGLAGITGAYGRRLRAAVISFGATARGAVQALLALGVDDITVMTQRSASAVESPYPSVRRQTLDPDPDRPGRVLSLVDNLVGPMAEALAEYDVVVNCMLQDTEAPLLFVSNDELPLFRSGTLVVDVSCDEGMGFEWARPTSFADPMFTVGDGVHYYAVDHSPSFLWGSSTWENSEALLEFLPVVMGGPDAWDANETIRRAIEIRDGVVVNPKILSFQNRAEQPPHAILG